MTDESDPLARLLRPLVSATWQPGDHAERLLRELEAVRPARSRRALLLAALAGALAATLIAATGGARFLQRLFGLEVVDVERDAHGNIDRITVHTDDARTLELKPWTDDYELERPVPVTLPRHGGGEVRVRVLRDRDLHVLPRFVQENASAAGEVTTGAKYTVREVPCPWTAAVTRQAVTLHPVAGGEKVVLSRVETVAGAPARYGNESTLLEVVDS
ncbi:MAG TPA: hypothetical protein VF384_17080 [Planctomycetota bacterium]